MKKILLFILACVLLFTCSCCKSEESESNNFEHKIALVCDLADVQNEESGFYIFEAIENFYNSDKNPARKYHPQSNNSVHIITTIENAIRDGNNVISVIGNDYGNAVSSIAAEYPYITFFVFGMTDAIALHNNIYCCNLDTDYLAFYKSILL